MTPLRWSTHKSPSLDGRGKGRVTSTRCGTLEVVLSSLQRVVLATVDLYESFPLTLSLSHNREREFKAAEDALT